MGIYPEKTTILKDICIPISLQHFTIARTWKQPGCPLTDEQIKKLWYIYTMEYNSDIKRSKSESVVVRWMNLEPFIQSEVRKRKTNIVH